MKIHQYLMKIHQFTWCNMYYTFLTKNLSWFPDKCYHHFFFCVVLFPNVPGKIELKNVKFPSPVCPLLVKLVCRGAMSNPSKTNGGRLTFFTSSELMLIGLWCFPVQLLYCSPQCDGPEKWKKWDLVRWRQLRGGGVNWNRRHDTLTIVFDEPWNVT